MRKLLVVFLATGFILSFAASDVFARGIIVKGGYSWMQEDYSDQLEDTWTLGVFFDMGTFVFNSLRFKPGIDWERLDAQHDGAVADLYGIHFDWYWHFLGNAPISPFLGFGPSLNYLSMKHGDDVSHAGVEVFAGAAFGITGMPFELSVEGRYRFVDIANRSQNIFSLLLGVEFKF